MIQLLGKDYDFTPLYEGNVSEMEVIIPHDLSCYQMTLGGDKQYLKYLVSNNDLGIALFIVSKEESVYRVDDSDLDFFLEDKEGDLAVGDKEKTKDEDKEEDSVAEDNWIKVRQISDYYDNNEVLGYSHFEAFIENLFKHIIHDLLVEVNILNIWEADREGNHFQPYPFYDVDDYRSDYTNYTVMSNGDSLFLDYRRSSGGRLLAIDEWFRNSDECLIGMLEEAIKNR